jgi:hypothetical protein
MAREPMIWNRPTMKVATSQAGLTAGTAVECQVTEARLNPTPTYSEIPSTGCAGATQSPGLTGYTLAVSWLQDWSKPAAESLSRFAWDNDGMPVWVELVPDSTDSTVSMEGQFYCASGGFGAVFGDGSAADTSADWPAVSKPDITSPVALAATAAT